MQVVNPDESQGFDEILVGLVDLFKRSFFCAPIKNHLVSVDFFGQWDIEPIYGSGNKVASGFKLCFDFVTESEKIAECAQVMIEADVKVIITKSIVTRP